VKRRRFPVGASPTRQPLQASRTVPIVFTQTQDPVGAGYVDSLARPGGNTTGFGIWHEREISGAAQRDRTAQRDLDDDPRQYPDAGASKPAVAALRLWKSKSPGG
jgi:hypothetical protein